MTVVETVNFFDVDKVFVVVCVFAIFENCMHSSGTSLHSSGTSLPTAFSAGRGGK